MVYISRLKLRNFKSFKAADIQLPKTFICFAGPNGSGKSNMCDAIRFAMGETSLRSLRARRVKDLIHTDAKSAEVTMVFESETDGKGYEIRRVIREDGKIQYKLNGERTTRSAILEALKQYNLDDSGRNTVAQGEVQRIIAMNGKERRTIIDSVAGISDFEEKKKEAMRELEVVDTRIKDSNLVLGERRAFIDELEKEKETALKYIDTKKKHTSAKGTILRSEKEKLEKDLEQIAVGEVKLNEERKKKEEDVSKIEEKIKEVDAKRAKTSQELHSKQDTHNLIRKIEELKAASAAKEQGIVDRKGMNEKAKSEVKKLTDEMEDEEKSVKKITDEIETLREEFGKAKQELAAHGGLIEDETVVAARKEVEMCEKNLVSLKEQTITLSSDIKSKRELIEAKKHEYENLLSSGVPAEAIEREEEIEKFKNESKKIGKQIEELFARTKAINNEIGNLDRTMLELKEKASIHKIRSTPHFANPALGLVSEIKQKGDRGIFGLVADQIMFEQKFAAAVEASAGGRLMYVIVDSVDTATAVIEKLKKARAGRATFIPLNTVRAPISPKVNGGVPILNVLSYSETIRPAIEYVFGETLLVENADAAKRIGIGNARMVTLEGEIFERSGIISGGRNEGSMLGANQMRKIENELAEIKTAKESLMQELYAIRDEESKLRAERAQADIKVKTIEMETRMLSERKKEMETLVKRKKTIEDETKTLEELIASLGKTHQEIMQAVENDEKQVILLKEKLKKTEEKSREHQNKTSQKVADMSAKVSALEATISGKINEVELRNKELHLKNERKEHLKKDEQENSKTITGLQHQLANEKKELAEIEEKLGSTSRAIEKLFEAMKEYENEFAKQGKEAGSRRIEMEKIDKEINQLNIKKATASTRLEDISAEFANYKEAELLDLPREELNRIVREAEEILSTIGNVNMAAIEMFDRKKAEIGEVEARIETLNKEREAVISMITEIDDRKKEAFFETFKVVSDQFHGLFKHVDIGEGVLYLDKAATPFESGLLIKIRRNNKDHTLDALSGGEKTLVALMFIFALQFFKPAPFYILDEVDAALDKLNSKRLSELVFKMAQDSQFIMVSHNDTVMSSAESVIGVTKVDGTSRPVGLRLKQIAVTS